MNNKFKGLYDNEKTSFITDRTNDGFYEPEIKTSRIQVHNYSINFDKKELYAEIERLNNIINELEKELNKKVEAIKTIKDMLGENAKVVNPHIEILEKEYNYFLYKLKELKEEGNK